jgi:hypothetical protein
MAAMEKNPERRVMADFCLMTIIDKKTPPEGGIPSLNHKPKH